MATEDATISILDEKIGLLKNEISENKLYLELCFIALLVLVFGYFRSDAGQVAIINKTMSGKLMIGVTVGLYLGVVYFFFNIIKVNQHNKKLVKEKIDRLVQK